MKIFPKSIKHIKMRNERKIEFSSENFDTDKYKHELKGYNVKITF